MTVRDKPRRRQTAATPIPPRQPNPTDMQLPDNPSRNQTLMQIQNVNPDTP